MDNLRAEDLLTRYCNGTASPEECRLVEAWYEQQETQALLEADDFLEDHFAIKTAVMAHARRSATPTFPFRRVIAIAAAVATLVFGIWFFAFRGQQFPSDRNLAYKNDVAPGKAGATLTLSNGRVISLNDAKNGVVMGSNAMTYDDGSVVSAQSSALPVEALTVTASTARGQTYTFTLSDGTKVWLNAASKLVFPASFSAAAERRVELQGEGYFEVTKDRKHPFIVNTKRQEVEVLGTHFNVNAYEEAPASITTLLEGAVRIKAASAQEVLKPNEQGLVSATGAILIERAKTRENLAWKNGYFRFYQESITDIMTKLSRWYNIEVHYEEVSKEKFSGNISMSKNISEVLDMLSYSGAVKFKIEGRRVTVMK